MKILKPKYYDDFACLASLCPDSCCKEWQVDIDARTARYYRSLPGPLGDRLREVLHDDDGNAVMTLSGDRCPMWREDGLCEIHAQLGHDALCQTCRDYPRLRHDYDDFVELGLELSCPAAAKLIFSALSDGFLEENDTTKINPTYEPEIMALLQCSRRNALDLLNNSTYSLPEALAIILLYGHAVQDALDGGEVPQFDPAALLSAARNCISGADMVRVFSFFSELEILTSRWKQRLLSGAVHTELTDTMRPLARYCIERYWLQAISDYDLVCRVKFTLIACILVNAMGGDPIATAQLFSKEIENDPDNVEKILCGAYTYRGFTDVNLLSLILGQKA